MLLSNVPAAGPRPDPIHRQQCLDQAARCRRLAYSVSDHHDAEQLLSMAAEYERNAWGPGQLYRGHSE